MPSPSGNDLADDLSRWVEICHLPEAELDALLNNRQQQPLIKRKCFLEFISWATAGLILMIGTHIFLN